MGKKSVALLGTGFGKIVHLHGFQSCIETEVTVVYNQDIAKAKEVADKFNIPQVSNKILEIIKMPDIQIVSIALPSFMHYEVAKEAIKAGKHILLEKPTTLNVQQALELYHLAQDKNVIIAVDFLFRYVPHWRYLKDLLSKNSVGKKRLITIEFLVQNRADKNRIWNWYSQKALGGGALGGHGSHIFDYISWLFSPVKSLTGKLITSIPELRDLNGEMRSVDADDTCSLLLELTDKTPCHICISGTTYGGVGHKIAVYGDAGTLILSNSRQDDYIHGFKLQQVKIDDKEVLELPLPCQYNLPQIFPEGRLAPFIALCEDFIKAINSKSPMTPGLREGVYSRLLMDLTYQSNLQEKWVEVPNLENLLSTNKV